MLKTGVDAGLSLWSWVLTRGIPLVGRDKRSLPRSFNFGPTPLQPLACNAPKQPLVATHVQQSPSSAKYRSSGIALAITRR